MSNVKLAVVFYSMGRTNYAMVKWAEKTKEAEKKLASESVIKENIAWKAIVNTTKDVPVENLEWADNYL